MSNNTETVRLTQIADFQFEAHFAAGVPALLCDEPPPLGQGQGPSPVQLLAAAVGNCLSASRRRNLTQCFSKTLAAYFATSWRAPRPKRMGKPYPAMNTYLA